MRRLIAVLAFLSCATVAPSTYEEADACPVPMTEEQRASGAVRCRAMCSSYARDFAAFEDDCKCRCQPARGGGYRPQAKPKARVHNET